LLWAVGVVEGVKASLSAPWHTLVLEAAFVGISTAKYTLVYFHTMKYKCTSNPRPIPSPCLSRDAIKSLAGRLYADR